MVWKSNIKNMDEEFNTLSKVNEQNVIMSNKQKFNLEETKTEYNNNYMGNMQKQIEGGENVIKKVKIPNKHLGERYKVVIEPCLKNLTTNVNVNVNNNEFSQNESSLLINNSKINPFSKLPTELASTFDKMITQLDIITKTMRIMETRISTVEGQITELYNIRKMGNFMEDKNVFNQNLENEVNNNNNNVGFENNVNNNVNDNIQENVEDNNENNNENNENFDNKINNENNIKNENEIYYENKEKINKLKTLVKHSIFFKNLKTKSDFLLRKKALAYSLILSYALGNFIFNSNSISLGDSKTFVCSSLQIAMISSISLLYKKKITKSQISKKTIESLGIHISDEKIKIIIKEIVNFIKYLPFGEIINNIISGSVSGISTFVIGYNLVKKYEREIRINYEMNLFLEAIESFNDAVEGIKKLKERIYFETN
jgi:hypothetical protein